MTNDRFRAEVVAALRAAAITHENGNSAAIGEAYDQLSNRLAELPAVDADVRVAVDFLDGWCDSSNHNWQFYEPLGRDDWPRLSLSLAASIEKREPIDSLIEAMFSFPPRRGRPRTTY